MQSQPQNGKSEKSNVQLYGNVGGFTLGDSLIAAFGARETGEILTRARLMSAGRHVSAKVYPNAQDVMRDAGKLAGNGFRGRA
jgi:hypothetical protein